MKRILKYIVRFPLITFALSLVLLFGVIFMGNKLRAQSGENNLNEQESVKQVILYNPQAEKYSAVVEAKVDRADTLTLVATANGIVTRMLEEGNKVARGGEVMKISDTYSGSSQAAAAAAVSARNTQYQKDVLEIQDDILDYQRDEVRRTGDEEARIEKKQITLQKRAAEFGYENAQLQKNQAYAATALYKTVAPFSGVIQEALVRKGDNVFSGQTVALLKSQDSKEVRLVAYVGEERAANIDVEGEFFAKIENGTRIPLEIIYIAQSGIGAQSYAVALESQEKDQESFKEGSFVEVELPIKAEEGIFVPIDAIHYGDDSSEIYVLENDRAVVKKVSLGSLIGSQVLVVEGLSRDELIIMDRSITDGQKVSVWEDSN